MENSRNIRKIVRIPSKLYSSLFNEGGDALLSVYSTLKADKAGEIKFKSFKSKNNKFVGGYSLLRHKTNISLATLKKYVPVLVNMGLIRFESKGDVSMLGNNKLKKSFGTKMIPVAVSEKLIETRYNCVSVRLHSAMKNQERRIERKKNLSELLSSDESQVKTLKKLKQIKRAKRKYSLEDLAITDQTVLSLQGFALLKCGEKDNKTKGAYWKRKLKQKGILATSRQFKLVEGMGMPYSQYSYLRAQGAFPKNTIYKYGGASEELISSFTSINIVDIFNNYSSLNILTPEV